MFLAPSDTMQCKAVAADDLLGLLLDHLFACVAATAVAQFLSLEQAAVFFLLFVNFPLGQFH